MSINRLPEFTFVFIVCLVDFVWNYRFGGERFPTFIPWRKFDIPDKQDVPSFVSSTIDSNSEVNFASIKLRRVDRATSLVEEQETIDEDADNASNPSLDSAPLNLFLCPEEGCIKSYNDTAQCKSILSMESISAPLNMKRFLTELCWGTRQSWRREQAWCLKYRGRRFSSIFFLF